MSQEPSPPFKIGNENKRKTSTKPQHCAIVHMQDPFTTNDVTIRDLLFLVSTYPCFVVMPSFLRNSILVLRY